MATKRKCQTTWRKNTRRWKESLAGTTYPSWLSGASARQLRHSWRLQTNFTLSTAWRTRRRWRRKWRPNPPASDGGTSRLAFPRSLIEGASMKMATLRTRRRLDKTRTTLTCNSLANRLIWSTWRCTRMRTCLAMMSPKLSWIVLTRSLTTMHNRPTLPKEPEASRLQEPGNSSAWRRRWPLWVSQAAPHSTRIKNWTRLLKALLRATRAHT